MIIEIKALVVYRLPNFAIPAAAEVLTTGMYSRLPMCIKVYIPTLLNSSCNIAADIYLSVYCLLYKNLCILVKNMSTHDSDGDTNEGHIIL